MGSKEAFATRTIKVRNWPDAAKDAPNTQVMRQDGRQVLSLTQPVLSLSVAFSLGMFHGPFACSLNRDW